jgi:CheY-like chemotaxis protein
VRADPKPGSGWPYVARADVGSTRRRWAETGAIIASVPSSVLVVDDDPVFRDLARRVLAAEGLVVVAEAESLETALDVARALRPDAALVDIGLPDGDGLTLARHLSELPWRPRIVLTSTDPDAASPEDLRRSGAGAFVAKHELPNAPLERLLGRD